MRIPLALHLVLLCGCSNLAPYQPGDPQFFADLGAHRRPITTKNRVAQRYFDQGLLLCYAFNHDEAIRAFQAAIRYDPSCAMAYWGIAFANGPNINLPMDEEHGRAAHAAAQTALAKMAGCTDVERGLIEALQKRYGDPPAKDQAKLDQAYAEAMCALHEAHPDDADVAALAADAKMNLRPWKLWSKDGLPAPGTDQIVLLLESALQKAPDHPGLCHFYIHTIEASPLPQRALEVARRLETLVPDSGHLVHMPGHIYMRCGLYADTLRVNQRAIEVDRAYFKRVGPQGVYEFYLAHNHHFALYAAMFEGRSNLAIQSARDIKKDFSPEVLNAMPGFADGFIGMIYHVLVRFGRWRNILDEPMPQARFPITTALHHYARGVALANTGRLDEAEAEQVAFLAAAKALPEGAVIGLTPAAPVMEIAKNMLAGEIAFRRGRAEEAFALLRTAIEGEEALPYDEPPAWMQPVRHALGALLLEAGRNVEAETVYMADLRRHPENGWSLHGLVECLRKRGAADEAAAALTRFRAAWARADTTLVGSCFCRAGG